MGVGPCLWSSFRVPKPVPNHLHAYSPRGLRAIPQGSHVTDPLTQTRALRHKEVSALARAAELGR